MRRLIILLAFYFLISILLNISCEKREDKDFEDGQYDESELFDYKIKTDVKMSEYDIISEDIVDNDNLYLDSYDEGLYDSVADGSQRDIIYYSDVDDCRDGCAIDEYEMCDKTPLMGVANVSAGDAHTCAVLANHRVLCWGDNRSGQLGVGSDIEYSKVPIPVVGIDNAVSISAKGYISGINEYYSYSCALLSDHRVKCWGDNRYGQLGDGTKNSSNVPVLVKGIENAIGVTVGGGHTCVLLESGGVKCWGRNDYGQLGDGTTGDSISPVDVVGLSSGVKQVSAGYKHTCALLENGGVKCWGDNRSGQLGDGTKENRLTPVDVVDLSSGVKEISAGEHHNCAVLEDGAAMCWGDNAMGVLGFKEPEGNNTPQSDTPVYVYGLKSGVAHISAGPWHTCAVFEKGGVVCWGANASGRLGAGYANSGATYTPVSADISGAINVTAGGDHTCALMNNSGVKCWGANNGGQLGDGSRNAKFTPVDVVICVQ